MLFRKEFFVCRNRQHILCSGFHHCYRHGSFIRFPYRIIQDYISEVEQWFCFMIVPSSVPSAVEGMIIHDSSILTVRMSAVNLEYDLIFIASLHICLKWFCI